MSCFRKKIGRYDYQWDIEILDASKSEAVAVSLSEIKVDTTIGYVNDSITHRLDLLGTLSQVPTEIPFVLDCGDGYEVITGHNTIVWHLHEGNSSVLCHVFTEDGLIGLKHLKMKDWQCLTGT